MQTYMLNIPPVILWSRCNCCEDKKPSDHTHATLDRVLYVFVVFFFPLPIERLLVLFGLPVIGWHLTSECVGVISACLYERVESRVSLITATQNGNIITLTVYVYKSPTSSSSSLLSTWRVVHAGDSYGLRSQVSQVVTQYTLYISVCACVSVNVYIFKPHISSYIYSLGGHQDDLVSVYKIFIRELIVL